MHAWSGLNLQAPNAAPDRSCFRVSLLVPSANRPLIPSAKAWWPSLVDVAVILIRKLRDAAGGHHRVSFADEFGPLRPAVRMYWRHMETFLPVVILGQVSPEVPINAVDTLGLYER
jgi:hypothetical protein